MGAEGDVCEANPDPRLREYAMTVAASGSGSPAAGAVRALLLAEAPELERSCNYIDIAERCYRSTEGEPS